LLRPSRATAEVFGIVGFAGARKAEGNMARSLVIVESPAKAKTINKYLGRDYMVKASIGHVMDLPKKTIGIRLPDVEIKKRKKSRGIKKGKAAEKVPKNPVTLDDPKIFEPTLLIISGKGKVINDLRKSASSAEAVYLAADPDREGEAISAHSLRTARTANLPKSRKHRSRRRKPKARRSATKSVSRPSIRRRFFGSASTKLRRRRFARHSTSRANWTGTW
jgi:DNA topoisomerase IA